MAEVWPARAPVAARKGLALTFFQPLSSESLTYTRYEFKKVNKADVRDFLKLFDNVLKVDKTFKNFMRFSF